MKLRGKLIAISLVPILIMATVLCLFVSSKVTTSMKAEVQAALQSTVYAIRDDISDINGNNYWLDEDNNLWNNEDYNVTEDTEAVDYIKEQTGIVVTIFYGKTRRMTSILDAGTGKRILGTDAGDAIIEKVLKGGNEYFGENVVINGGKYFAYYVPMYNEGSNTPVGMVFAGKSQDEVEGAISAITTGMLLVTLALVVLSVVASFYIALRICKRMNTGVEALASVANGDLTIEVEDSLLKTKDETGDIARSVQDLKEKLTEVIKGIIQKSNDVNDCSQALGDAAEESAGTMEQVEHAVSEIAEGATSQAADTTNATEQVITMGNLVEETNATVDKLNEVSDKMEKIGHSATQTVGKLSDVSEQTKSAIDVIYNQTNTTNDSAKKISEAVTLITSIAEETNLLSLNASIEAARAGEQGRGFAVVASQISKLAEQSNESAKRIGDIITSLLEDSQKAVETMDEVKEIMQKQSEMVAETGNAFNEVIDEIKNTRSNAEDISSSMKKLNSSRESVTDIVSNLSAIAEENAASTEETSASTTEVSASMQEISAEAAHLKSIAADLHDAVSVFKI